MKGSKGKICLYGEWRLAEIRKAGWVILVEGESDTQTLWCMGLPAIGIAGASMFKAYQTMVLQGLKIYIQKEPDVGGETFFSKVCNGLNDTGFTGEVCVWSCQRLSKKDPSEVYLTYDKNEAARLIEETAKRAEAVSLEQEMRQEAITGAPNWLATRPALIPGHDDGITLNIDPSQRGMATAYCRNGTMERWIEHMAPHRQQDKLRCILAASFAAPLLRIVKQRIFFVYHWGGSKGDKTAALSASKSGGLQTIHQWRTVALATGEEPLSTETTQTGVSTRVLEIYGGSFDQ